nr:hypothetical protein Iba_chr05fCG5640 [Ipomoea batatas]
MRSKPKMTACTNMERNPVFIFRKSTGRFLPGIWKINPGARNANSAVAMIGAPQSFIFKLTAGIVLICRLRRRIEACVSSYFLYTPGRLDRQSR